MSLGKLTNAVVSGTVENTWALANLNFDFSLVRVDAPVEYKDIGSALSSWRHRDAETGISHITARKLAALFKDVVPDVPNLLRAYGLRASEIIKSPKHNPKGSPGDGLFAEQVGADGTTLWAAATSGHAAIAMHLLACMLARMWPGPEAVAIWVELILERKRLLSNHDQSDPLNTTAMTASHISLSREQLAKWDASARSWLLTADHAYGKNQKQTLLIVNNLSLAIPGCSTLYESVVKAWISAMTMVDRLVAGIPQSAHGGASLLGLSAWHIYPDLVVICDGVKVVRQKDTIVTPGGRLTIGLKHRKTDEGISWSLPLGHLLFYGDPVLAKSSLNTQTSRVSIEQFLLVALGSILSSWLPGQSFFRMGAEFLRRIYRTVIGEPYFVDSGMESSWLAILDSAAHEFLSSKGTAKTECVQLLRTGARRYKALFGYGGGCQPFFGLTRPENLIHLMREEEHRIMFLRNTAQSFSNVAGPMVIQYRHHGNAIEQGFECASVDVGGATGSGLKRSWDGIETKQNQAPIKRRWIEADSTPSIQERVQELERLGERVVVLDSGTRIPNFQSQVNGSWKAYRPSISDDGSITTRSNCGVQWHNPPANFPSDEDDRKFSSLHFLYGIPGVAALYAVQDDPVSPREESSLDEAIQVLESGTIHPVDLALHLADVKKWSGYEAIKAFSAVAALKHVYNQLAGATICLRSASWSIGSAKWVPKWRREWKISRVNNPLGVWDIGSLMPYQLNLKEVFACISMMESGECDLEPSTLGEVLAISSGNSLFVPEVLVSDPMRNEVDSSRMRRVVGSLGRPGVALLVSPQNPRMREVDDDSWTCINHNDFDGKPENCFESTSLHLSFSDWELPINIGRQGLRDSQIYFLETPISLHHRGEWIADLNILKALSSERLCRYIKESPPCAHSDDSKLEVLGLVSIDSWEELLEHPMERGVIRAHGNWQARLAASALSVQRQHHAIIVSDVPCWACCTDWAERSFAAGRAAGKPKGGEKEKYWDTPGWEDDDYDDESDGEVWAGFEEELADEDYFDAEDQEGYSDANELEGDDHFDAEERDSNKKKDIDASSTHHPPTILYIL